MAYSFYGIGPVQEDAERIRKRSVYVPTPANAVSTEDGRFIAFNRFNRPDEHEDENIDTDILPKLRRHTLAHVHHGSETQRIVEVPCGKAIENELKPDSGSKRRKAENSSVHDVSEGLKGEEHN